MTTIQSFEDIKAWQSAQILATSIHKITSAESFGHNRELRNQMQRAAISVMSNIAEGFERDGRKEFIYFLSIAKASAGELRSQLYLAMEMDHITKDEFHVMSSLAYETSRLIGGFINYLKSTSIPGTKFKAEHRGGASKKDDQERS